MTRQILKVKGMHCASCASVITKKLSVLPHIQSVSVNYANEKAKIDYDDNHISIDSMNDEIGKLGYSFVSEKDHVKDGHDHTAMIENELDEIAEGNTEWVPVVRNFYKPFKEHLVEKEKSVEKQQSVSTTPCPHCGEFMIIKFGRMGKFLACPDPESKVTQPMPEEAAKIKELEEKTKDEKCPICEAKMNVKRGRFGFFLGCSRYPECKGISKIWNKTGYKCPLCLETPERQEKPGDIVEKKSRGRGKPFYACTRYPDCTLIFNKKPETDLELIELFKAWKEAPLKKTEESSKGGVKKKAVAKKKVAKKKATTKKAKK
jgi:ssDNA-binding Zn-finger/Zn-ribbon topoisomerase 1/copper chaperone CopZ